jgi:hypothetical protein
MRNPNEEYDRLHDHMSQRSRVSATGCNSNRIITTLEARLTDELHLAHEALREFGA